MKIQEIQKNIGNNPFRSLSEMELAILQDVFAAYELNSSKHDADSDSKYNQNYQSSNRTPIRQRMARLVDEVAFLNHN